MKTIVCVVYQILDDVMVDGNGDDGFIHRHK